jgi:hypothetical protein
LTALWNVGAVAVNVGSSKTCKSGSCRLLLLICGNDDGNDMRVLGGGGGGGGDDDKILFLDLSR